MHRVNEKSAAFRGMGVGREDHKEKTVLLRATPVT